LLSEVDAPDRRAVALAVPPEHRHLVLRAVSLLGFPGELADVATVLLRLHRVAADQVLERVGLAIGLELLDQLYRLGPSIGPFLGRLDLVQDDPAEEDAEQGKAPPADHRRNGALLLLLFHFSHANAFRWWDSRRPAPLPHGS